MKYPPRRGRAAPIAPMAPPIVPPGRPPMLTPQQAAMLPSGARFVGLDGLPRIVSPGPAPAGLLPTPTAVAVESILGPAPRRPGSAGPRTLK